MYPLSFYSLDTQVNKKGTYRLPLICNNKDRSELKASIFFLNIRCHFHNTKEAIAVFDNVIWMFFFPENILNPTKMLTVIHAASNSN